jgi:hypothetical protein
LFVGRNHGTQKTRATAQTGGKWLQKEAIEMK